MAKAKSKNNDNTANLGFEATLWAAADALPTRVLTDTAKFARRAAA